MALSCPKCGAEATKEGKPFTERGLHLHTLHCGSSATRKPKASEAPAEDAFTDETEAPPRVSWFARTFGKKSATNEPRPRKPRASRQGRTSLAPVGALAWTGGAALAAKSGDYPVAAVMQIQASIAGDVLDRALQGTPVDRVVQPLLSGTDKYKDLGMLVAFPFLVAIHERRPSAATWGALRLVAQENLVGLAKGLKDAKAEAEKMAEVVAELDVAGLGLDEKDPVGSMLSMLGLHPEGAVQATPEPVDA